MATAGDATSSAPRTGGTASTGATPPKAGAPGVQQVNPPDIAVQIMRRLEALERENQQMRDQLALAESQRSEIPGDASSTVPPPPAPYGVPSREQGTVDTRLLGKPVNGVKDEHQSPIFSRLLKAYVGALDSGYVELLNKCGDLAEDVGNLSLSQGSEDSRNSCTSS